MKAILGSFAVAALLASGPLLATVMHVETIEQPVNLGAYADPDRIPLGPVVVETNHGFDLHKVISLPRPCTHGALILEKGQELNMNLASAFGIEVVPEDGTLVPLLPVTIVVKDWPVPSYSPYRKDQVLSATLHCLLRSVSATPKTPLKVLIEAENQEDAKNLKGFAGSYLTADADEHGGPTPVPGTRLSTDARGITYVVLTDAKALPADAPHRQPPVLVPFLPEDETGDNFYQFIPVWPGDGWKEDRRTIIAQPVTLFHDLFNNTTSTGPDINAITRSGVLSQHLWFDTVEGTRLWLSLSNKNSSDLPRLLAALCHAVILTTQPGKQTPLTIDLEGKPEFLKEHLADFLADKKWALRDAREEGRSILSCTFVWDQDARRLTRGSVPRCRLSFNGDRPWSLTFPPAHVAAE